MRIRHTRRAARDLESIAAWLEEEGDDPSASARMVLRVLGAIEHLAMFPNMGRPGRLPGTRELPVGGTPYIVVYKVRGNTLWIARVLHAAMKWP